MLTIRIFYHPNNQFLLWDPRSAEILRTVYGLSITGSGNCVAISQVAPPVAINYKQEMTNHDKKTAKNQNPTFENTESEQNFDIYSRIGAAPYSLPNFQLFSLLTTTVPGIEVIVYDTITSHPILNLNTFKTITTNLYRALQTPSELPSQLVQIIHSPLAQSIAPSPLSLHSPLPLLSKYFPTPVTPPLLTSTPLSRQINLLSCLLSLFTLSPLGILHRDLLSRGLYITEGFHYNLSLTIYDPLTHYRAYNQAPPTALTGGQSQATNPSTVTWDDRDPSNAVWRCYPCVDSRLESLRGFTLERYAEEKRAMTQGRLDGLKEAWLELERKKVIMIAEGRARKYGKNGGENGNVGTTRLDGEVKSGGKDHNTMNNGGLLMVKDVKGEKNQMNVSDEGKKNNRRGKHFLDDEIDFENQNPKDENDDEDEDDDDINLDPLLHVHSRWLLQLLCWNDGKSTFTMPHESPTTLTPHPPTLTAPPASFPSPPPDLILTHPPSVLNPPTPQTNHPTPSDPSDKLTAWRNRNRFVAKSLSLGLKQDMGYLDSLEQQRHYQRQLCELTTDPNNQEIPTTGAVINFKNQLLDGYNELLGIQSETKGDVGTSTFTDPKPHYYGTSYSQPSVGYPELSLSIEEAIGAVRLTDAIKKKLLLVAKTPNIFLQTQKAHLIALNSLKTNVISFSSDEYNKIFEESIRQNVQFDQDNQNDQNTEIEACFNKNSHFSYFTMEADGAMTVVGFYKRVVPQDEVYLSSSSFELPSTRPALVNMEEEMVYLK
jgi:hypothetical protein